MVRYNEELGGIDIDNIIDVSVESKGIIEVYTYSPSVCCIAIVGLNITQASNLITILQDAIKVAKGGIYE